MQLYQGAREDEEEVVEEPLHQPDGEHTLSVQGGDLKDLLVYRRGLTDSEKGWSGNTYIWSSLGTMLTRLMPLSVAAGMAWKQCSVSQT